MMWWLPAAASAVVLGSRYWSRQWWSRRVRERLTTRPASTSPSRVVRRWRSVRRSPDPIDAVAPTLDTLARSVAGGTGLSGALASLGSYRSNPFAERLTDAHARHRLGLPLAAAVADVARPTDPAEVALALGAIGAAARHGGAQASALDRAAVAVRQRRAVSAERRVSAAQASLSAMVLVALPPVFALWNLLTSRRMARFMFTSPIGWVCTLSGIALDVAGWRWMRRLIGSDT